MELLSRNFRKIDLQNSLVALRLVRSRGGLTTVARNDYSFFIRYVCFIILSPYLVPLSTVLSFYFLFTYMITYTYPACTSSLNVACMWVVDICFRAAGRYLVAHIAQDV